MSVHWKQLDTAGRIAAIRDVWVPGCSSTQIAAHFDGATRNSIIGTFHRYPNSFIDMPLNRTAVDEAHRQSTKRKQSPVFLFKNKSNKPLPAAEWVASESHVCGRPIYLLSAKQCRWAVNEAERNETHLFCSLDVTSGPYCDHHKTRAVAQP